MAFVKAVVLHEIPGRMRVRPTGGVIGTASATALESLPGVRSARVNRRAACVVVEHDGRAATRAGVLRALNDPGFHAPAGTPRLEDDEPNIARPAFSAAAAIGSLFLPARIGTVLALICVAPTLILGARTLATKGVKVQVLDALSLGVALARRERFAACATQFLLDLAEHIEESTGRKSDHLINRLLRAGPETAMVERDGEVRSVPFAEIVRGDRVHIQAGDQIPVDGRVIDGGATVNQSSITGESIPIPKEPGDPALSGTVLEEGRLVVIAERVGDATTTARITRFILEALGRRGSTQRMAEELADKRVWISLVSGGIVFALTRDTRRLASMFLVDYSCALKLGAAVAIKSALYRAARSGILVKGGEALETLAAIDTVVFDKTGTLTHGDLTVTDVIILEPDDWSRERFLATIASVAEHSTHPVSAAVVTMARGERLNHIGHEEVNFVVGHGLAARNEAGTLHIGSRHYLADHENVSFSAVADRLDALEAEGKTLLHVALDGRPLGVIALRDRPRAEGAAVLRRLRALGIKRLAMVTGDRRETAAGVARDLGLDLVVHEADPETKADVIRRLKAGGGKVAFVGDGVNDGPALMTADAGVAMPKAADIARATADVVLMDDRLDALADAIDISRSAMARIRRGFVSAVGVNTGIMAGASLGWLPPVAASALHNGTTIALLADAVSGSADGRASPNT